MYRQQRYEINSNISAHYCRKCFRKHQLFRAFYYFQTHSAVMVGTFPETGLVINSIQGTIGMTTPEPFAMIPVYQLCLDIFPATYCLLQGFLVTELLIEVKPPYYILSLYPPMQVIIHMPCREICLMNHRAVWTKSFLRCLCHHTDYRFHLGKHFLVT